jgi:hypothetical protein
MTINMKEIDILLDDLKDFYVWKQFKNDDEFITKWIKNREELINSVPRSMMSK